MTLLQTQLSMPIRKSFSALDLARKFISENVSEGDICIDATAGRGNDTLLLCSLVGDGGMVYAFDIQQDAITSTEQLLEQNGCLSRASLILDSHANMDKYVASESVSCIVFNFGWLPGGDHSIFTRASSSIDAIEKGLSLLRPDGVMCLCIYYGRENGFDERDALLEYLEHIDSREYTVVISRFANRGGCPPIPVFIYKGM